MIIPNEKQKVRDFIEMNVKPFTTKQCSISTGVNVHSVREYMKNFCKQGIIQIVAREGQRKIYIKITDKMKRRKIQIKRASEFMNENRMLFYFGN